jgi:lipopolysaccharide/colanic/teichoic acid biosynthesis glycosyltransferase
MIRATDLLGSLFLLIIISPLLLLVAVVLKFTGEGRVFFYQRRIGINRKPFSIIKFATMKENSPNIGAGMITLKEDPRILPVGKVLRKTKINELPQLINIILGQMSFIGPRPMTDNIFYLYSDEAQYELSKMKPGLSGIGSIFFRSEENILTGDYSSKDFYAENISPYKGMLEMWYAKNVCYSIYILLLFLTIYVVLFPRARVSFLWKFFPNLPVPTRKLRSLLNL